MKRFDIILYYHLVTHRGFTDGLETCFLNNDHLFVDVEKMVYTRCAVPSNLITSGLVLTMSATTRQNISAKNVTYFHQYSAFVSNAL